MPQGSRIQSANPGKASDNPAWRGRTATACAILAIMVLGACASTLDWSEGLAMIVGQLAGMIAPLVALSLIGRAVVALVSRSR
jgi:hypothetical protein